MQSVSRPPISKSGRHPTILWATEPGAANLSCFIVVASIDTQPMKDSRTSAMDIPTARKYTCPLTNTIMEEPVSVPCCSTNFERTALLSWMRKNGNRCPQTGKPLMPSHLKPNTKLQWEILYLERRNSNQIDCSERSSVSASPVSSSKGDCPPLHPRSPREGCTRKFLSGEVGTFPATKSHAVEPTEPIPRGGQSTTGNLLPLKNVDSPPTLPRRFNASLMPLPKIVLSLSADTSMDGVALPTRRSSSLSSTPKPCR